VGKGGGREKIDQLETIITKFTLNLYKRARIFLVSYFLSLQIFSMNFRQLFKVRWRASALSKTSWIFINCWIELERSLGSLQMLSSCCRLGWGGGRQGGDPAANLPGSFPAQQCHAWCSWASLRKNHGDASGAAGESSGA